MENLARAPRRRFTPAQRAEFVARYRQSGLTQRAFADQHKVGLSTLVQWLRRPSSNPPASRPVFKEVLLPSAGVGWAAEIALGKEITVRLGASASPKFIAQLIKRLGRSC
jgi:transposase-like protein